MLRAVLDSSDAPLSVCLSQVLKVPADHPLLFQRSLRRSELRYIFAHAPDPSRSPVLAADAVRAAVAASLGVPLHVGHEGSPPVSGQAGASAASGAIASAAAANATLCAAAVDAALEGALKAAEAAGARRAVEADDDCPICFDALGAALGLLTYCVACRGTVHAACMAQWGTAKRAKGEAVSCPCCR